MVGRAPALPALASPPSHPPFEPDSRTPTPGSRRGIRILAVLEANPQLHAEIEGKAPSRVNVIVSGLTFGAPVKTGEDAVDESSIR
jgi:hypothetical protein